MRVTVVKGGGTWGCGHVGGGRCSVRDQCVCGVKEGRGGQGREGVSAS